MSEFATLCNKSIGRGRHTNLERPGPELVYSLARDSVSRIDFFLGWLWSDYVLARMVDASGDSGACKWSVSRGQRSSGWKVLPLYEPVKAVDALPALWCALAFVYRKLLTKRRIAAKARTQTHHGPPNHQL